MKEITFLGAGGDEVTGSNYIVTANDNSKIMVDFGMFQGNDDLVQKNYEKLGFHAPSLQGVFLTHAHLDHCGRLPLLVYKGYLGKIYMTEPTKSFIHLILTDSARIAEKDITKPQLYTLDEVWKTLDMIEVVEYNKPFTVGSFTITYRDAGHILGAASIEIFETNDKDKKTIVFSGDLGNSPQQIVKPTQYIEKADYVVMESTYGNALHPDEDATKIIQEEINAVEKENGVLLIPSFAIERTQEILHIVHHLKKDKKIEASTPVFLDSPMGIEATEIYSDFKKFYNDEIQSHSDNPFDFEGLVITADAKDSKNIIKEGYPKVIIAGSGMMSGGRILHHAENYLSDERTRLLFVGYQAEETLGRAILEGAHSVQIEDAHIKVQAHIREIKILSSHADQPKLMTWLSNIKNVSKVFLVHGEKAQRETLAEKIKKDLLIPDVVLPKNGETIQLSS